MLYDELNFLEVEEVILPVCKHPIKEETHAYIV